MNEKEYITTWLNKMIAKFDWITFRYEYSYKLLAHCIEVLPSNSLEESEEYATNEYDFSCDFENLFGESIVFSDGNKFCKCSDNAEIFSFSAIAIFQSAEWTKNDNFILDLKDYVIDFHNVYSENTNIPCYEEIYNFDLAA